MCGPTGSFSGSLGSLSARGSDDAFLARVTSSGLQWAVQVGGTSTDVGQSVCSDGAGGALVSGRFMGTITVSYTHLTLPTICSV